MKYLSLLSLFSILALIPGCWRDNGSGYQRSCCPTTSCEAPASTEILETQAEEVVTTEAPAMSAPQKEESIEIEEELDEAGDKEDLSSDKEDLDDATA